ncbi:MAG: serine hydrolase domain-containing protein [Pseudomonadota bacterium]
MKFRSITSHALLLGSCVAAALTGCQTQTGTANTPSAPQISASASPELTQVGLDIVSEVQQWLAAQKTDGAVAVSYRGAPVIKQGFGRSTETPYPVASLSKAITSICLQHLLDVQQLSNTMTLSEAIPDLLQQYPPADNRLAQVSLAQLMSHNSGIHSRYHRNYIADKRAFNRFDMNAQFKALARERMAAAPGSGYHYSNANYLLLGLAVEALSQQAYDTYCNNEILVPAGINADINPPWRVMSAWGGWRVSASDYLKFLNTYFADSKVIGKSVAEQGVGADVGRGALYTHGVFTRTANGGARFWHAGSWSWKDQTRNSRFGAYFVTREDGLMVSVNYATSAQNDPLRDLENRLVRALKL